MRVKKMNSITVKKLHQSKIKDTYSGKLLLRMDLETHKKLAIEAQKLGVSINLLINNLIEEHLNG